MASATTPRSTLLMAGFLILAVSTFMVSLAQSALRTGISWEEGPQNTLVITNLSEEASKNTALMAGTVVTHFITPEGRVTASPVLRIEEPDTLPDYASYNAFLKEQGKIATALKNNKLEVLLADGQQIPLETYPTHWRDLPFLFWFQIFVGIAGAMTGVMVWTLGEKNKATFFYAMTGIGYLIFAPSAGVYSTRELVLDADIFRALSLTNHFGSFFFTGSLTALLWNYPRSLGNFPAASLSYLIAFICWLLDTLQVFKGMYVFHFGVLGVFALSFVFGFLQWKRSRGNPVEKAILRWFLLSIYLATGLFAGFIIIPAAFHWPLPAPQGLMFGAFLIMYFGLALGMMRYRLFQLEGWWYSIWGWFLSGIAIVIFDVLLISALQVPENIALIASVAVVGWLYFPVRQWLLKKMGRQQQCDIKDWLPHALPLLIQPTTSDNPEQEMRARWPTLLNVVFSPRTIEKSDGPTGIFNDGLSLRTDAISLHHSRLIMHHAQNGYRLFTRQDLETLVSLRQLFDLVLAMQTQNASQLTSERHRIARDLDEGLNNQLLTILSNSQETERPFIREAIMQSRELVTLLHQTPVLLAIATSRWFVELKEQCETCRVSLTWKLQGNKDGVISLTARQHTNLNRILNEAVSHSIEHAKSSTISIQIDGQENHLHIQIKDNGKECRSEEINILSELISQRTKEIDGHCQQYYESGYIIDIMLPL